MAIHDLHARGYRMIADDGTIIPQVPAQPDLVDKDEFYEPARFRLTKAPRPMTRIEITRRSGVRGYGRQGRPVSGIVWSRDEFLALPWVENYLPAGGLPGSEKDPRGQICGRYGERIPADQAVIDMAADNTAAIAATARGGPGPRRCSGTANGTPATGWPAPTAIGAAFATAASRRSLVTNNLRSRLTSKTTLTWADSSATTSSKSPRDG